MINILTVAAASALALSAQDISSSTGVEIDTPVDLQAELDAEINSSGVIAKSDVEIIAKTEFEAADVNGDMTVTEDEFVTAALVADGTVETDEELTESLDGAPLDEMDADVDAQPSAAEYFRTRFAAISNGDGELTGIELESALKEEFAVADEDGDEQLTGAEVQTFASIRKGQMTLR